MKKSKLFGAPIAIAVSAMIPLTADSVDERLRKQEIELQAIKEQMGEMKGGSSGGWPSWFKLGGEWEVEYVDTESDSNIGDIDSGHNSHARLQHDKFLLKPKVTFAENFYMKGELEFDTGGANMEEMQVWLKGLPMDSYLKVGLDERFGKADGKFDMADRKTEAYPLLGTAFWRDEQLAATWGGKTKLDMGVLKDVFWGAAVGNGLELSVDTGTGGKQPSEDDSLELSHDNDAASDTVSQKWEWQLGLGLTFQPMENYKFDVAAWHVESELNNDEKTQLAGITGFDLAETGIAGTEFGSNPSFNSRQTRRHFRTTHKIENATITYELADARDAAFKRDAWYIQGSYKFKFKPLINGEFIKGIEPLIRYEEYETNLDPVWGDADTWEREQTVYALLIDLTSSKNLKTKLKLEYYVNEEDSGALPGDVDSNGLQRPEDPDNDEFLAQLELKF